MDISGDGLGYMSEYEQARWNELATYWHSRARRREVLVPEKVRGWGQAASNTASKALRRVGDLTPDSVKSAASVAADKVLTPTIESVVHLLELLNDWVIELNDPRPVVAFHQKQGRDIASVHQIKAFDLEDVESFLKMWELKWRTVGAAEGGAAGALAMIPVPIAGSAAAITVDIVAMQALTTAVATRLCHTYGFEANNDAGRELINRMVRGAYLVQTGKVSTVRGAADAFRESSGRVNWSAKLRENHRLLEAVEKLMKNAQGVDHIPVGQARMGIPLISVLVGSGTNAFVLGNTAKQAKRYCATRFLADKYGLPLPRHLNDPENDSAPDD